MIAPAAHAAENPVAATGSGRRARTLLWIAALTLLTVAVPQIGYTATVAAAEAVIAILFAWRIATRTARRTPLDLLIGLWLLGEVFGTIRGYAAGWGAHSPCPPGMYDGGPLGPVHLLIDSVAGFAAYYAVSWEPDAARAPARQAAPLLVAASATLVLCVLEQAHNCLFGTYDPRVQATFTNPNLLAAFLCLTCPLAAGAALESRFQQSRRVAAGVLAAGLAVSVLLTQSRGGILGAGIGLGYVAAVGWSRSGGTLELNAMRGRRAARWVAAGCLLIVGIGLALFPHVLHESRAISDNHRHVTWTAAVTLIRSHPIFGVGLDGFPAAMKSLRLLQINPYTKTGLPLQPAMDLHTHDLFLQSWIERGLLGAVTTAVFAFLLLRRSLALLTRPGSGSMLAAGAAGGALAWLTQNISDYTLWYAPINIALWYLLSLMFTGENSDNSPS